MPSMFVRPGSSVVRVPTGSGSTTHRQSTAIQLSDAAISLLGSAVCRALTSERDHDMKKKAAKEIEDVIRFVQERDVGVAREKTTAIIGVLTNEFLTHSSKEVRIGGLIGLVGVAQGLKDNCKYYLAQIIMPMISLASSTIDPHIRYYAAESLYNLCLLTSVDTVVFLDDLLEIVFRLWGEAEDFLQRAAKGWDPVLREMARENAAPTQLAALAPCIIDEASRKTAIPPVHVLPWCEVILDRVSGSSEPINIHIGSLTAALLSMSQFRLTSQQVETLEQLLEKCANLIRKEPDAKNILITIEARIESLIQDRHTAPYAMIIGPLFALAGIRGARKRALELDTAHLASDCDQKFVTEHAAFFVGVIMELLVSGCPFNDLLKGFENDVQTVVLASKHPNRKQILREVAETAGETLTSLDVGKPNGALVAGMALRWISTVALKDPDHSLPNDCFRAVVALISSDWAQIRALATKCVIELCIEDSARESLLKSTVVKLILVTSVAQSQAYLEVLHELCGDEGFWLRVVDPYVTSLPDATLTEAVSKSFLIWLLTYRLLKSEKLVTGDDIKSLKCFDSAPLCRALALIDAAQEVSSLKEYVGFATSSGQSIHWDWMILELELFVLFLELPRFARFRMTAAAQSLYSELRALLPIECSTEVRNILAVRQPRHSQLAELPPLNVSGARACLPPTDINIKTVFDQFLVILAPLLVGESASLMARDASRIRSTPTTMAAPDWPTKISPPQPSVTAISLQHWVGEADGGAEVICQNNDSVARELSHSGQDDCGKSDVHPDSISLPIPPTGLDLSATTMPERVTDHNVDATTTASAALKDEGRTGISEANTLPNTPVVEQINSII